ncbi:TPA: response regulator transcription factor [Elizabethkingia anophelis]|nr:response regulator transcription factor [Elizabethkingia anophelis]
MKTKILIADANYPVRVGVTHLIKENIKNVDIQCVTQYEEVKAKLSRKAYTLLILDIDMPGSKYRDMISELKNIQSDIKILLYTPYKQDTITQYVREGADGYLHKSANENEILNAISNILQYGHYYPASLVNLILKEAQNPPSVTKLSDKEREIARFIVNGYTNFRIAHVLEISPSKVSTFKCRILQKLQIHSTDELMTMKDLLH